MIEEIRRRLKKISIDGKPIYPSAYVFHMEVSGWARIDCMRQYQSWYPDGIPFVDGDFITRVSKEHLISVLKMTTKMMNDRRINEQSLETLRGWKMIIRYELDRRDWIECYGKER